MKICTVPIGFVGERGGDRKTVEDFTFQAFGIWGRQGAEFGRVGNFFEEGYGG